MLVELNISLSILRYNVAKRFFFGSIWISDLAHISSVEIYLLLISIALKTPCSFMK